MIPQGLGAMVAMPLAGIFMDRHGPARIVLLAITLTGPGPAMSTHGSAIRADYVPTLLAGLAIMGMGMGMGMGCTMMPLAGAVAATLAPHQIARGSTLVSVNQQVAGSVGTAVMSMFLTPTSSTAAKTFPPHTHWQRCRTTQLDAACHGIPPPYRAKPLRPASPPTCCTTSHRRIRRCSRRRLYWSRARSSRQRFCRRSR